MKAAKLSTLRSVSLLFLLPGLAGLVLSAVISTHYMDTLPQGADPEQGRIVPRNINGSVVYQTQDEDLRLTLLEYSSVGIFVIGLSLGLVYLEKWGGYRARELEEEEATES